MSRMPWQYAQLLFPEPASDLHLRLQLQPPAAQGLRKGTGGVLNYPAATTTTESHRRAEEHPRSEVA